jgi:CDGSH-type Zn-finger protein
MEKPRIAAKQPAVLQLDPGTYYWCLCGRSRDQPFCDGSHHGTGFEPVEFTLSEKEEVALCQCKQTRTPPFCDGTHATL